MKLTTAYLVATGLITHFISAFEPDDPYFKYNPQDPSNPGQWYLYNLLPKEFEGEHNAGLDINVSPAWQKGITGKGVVIGIVDDGVQSDHPDIALNYRADLSHHFYEDPLIQQYPQGTFQRFVSRHGTLVAGVAAATGGNKIGITGVAPEAGLASLEMGPSPSITCPLLHDKVSIEKAFLEEIISSSPEVCANAIIWSAGLVKTNQGYQYVGESKIDVDNFSINLNHPFYQRDYPPLSPSSVIFKALHATTKNNVINIVGSGNDSKNAIEESILSEAAIMVSSMGFNGKKASFSNFGPSIFVAAPSHSGGLEPFRKVVSILTTDLTGQFRGYNPRYCFPINPVERSISCNWTYGYGLSCHVEYPFLNDEKFAEYILYYESQIDTFHDSHYTTKFGGTSASAPMIAGVMALGRQVNPLLDVRLAKHVLVKTSRKIDPENLQWITNSAGNIFNPYYGFGLVDASAFVDKVKAFSYVTSPKEVNFELHEIPLVLNDGSLVIPFTLGNNPTIANTPLEHIRIHLHTVFDTMLCKGGSSYSEINVLIESPSGVQSTLLDQVTLIPHTDLHFVTNAFWGEPLAGEWKLIFIKENKQNDLPFFLWAIRSIKVIAHLGKAVEETPSMVIEDSLEAESITLKKESTHLHIKPSAHVTLKEGILLKNGKSTIEGTVDQTDFKGSRITLDGGLLTGSGKIYAKRGVQNNMGEFSPNRLIVFGSYEQGPNGIMTVNLTDEGKAALVVTDNALLNGELRIVTKHRTQKLKIGDGYDVIVANNILDAFEKLNVDNESEDYRYSIDYVKDKISVTVIQDDKQCLNPDYNVKKGRKETSFLDSFKDAFGSKSYSFVIVNQKEVVIDGRTFKIRLQNAVHPTSQELSSKDPNSIGFADSDTELVILDENNNTFGIVPLTVHQSVNVSNQLYGKKYAFTIQAHQDISKSALYLVIQGKEIAEKGR